MREHELAREEIFPQKLGLKFLLITPLFGRDDSFSDALALARRPFAIYTLPLGAKGALCYTCKGHPLARKGNRIA
jgi:hypothetical protein